MDIKFKSSEGFFGSSEPLEADDSGSAIMCAEMRRATARAIHNLSYSSIAREHFADELIIHNVTQLCDMNDTTKLRSARTSGFVLSDATSEELRRIGTRILYNMSASMTDACNAALVRESGATALLEMCRQFGEDEQAGHLAACALHNLSRDPPRRRRSVFKQNFPASGQNCDGPIKHDSIIHLCVHSTGLQNLGQSQY